jgi:hypothetical protein
MEEDNKVDFLSLFQRKIVKWWNFNIKHIGLLQNENQTQMKTFSFTNMFHKKQVNCKISSINYRILKKYMTNTPSTLVRETVKE